MRLDGDVDSSESLDYKILRRIGQGAFGEVFQAVHRPTGQLRALKRVFNRQDRHNNINNLRREYLSLQAVNSVNVIRLLDHFKQGSSLVLILEYCCSDLADLIGFAAEPFAEAFVKSILQQLLQGVNACHQAGVLHRDIKPSNVLLTQDGHVKLADFGHARLEDNNARPLYTHAVATRWYRAPELLYGARSYGRGIDIWAVGCIFAELLGMCPLVAGETDIDQLGRVTAVFGTMEASWPGVAELPDYGKITFAPCEGFPLEQLLPEASASAVQLLKRFLQLDPGQRCSAAEALADGWFTSNPLPMSHGELCHNIQKTVAAKQAWLLANH